MRQRSVKVVGRTTEQDKACQTAENNGDDLSERRWHREDKNSGGGGKRRALAVRRERAHHGKHRIGDDRDGGDFQSVQPASAKRITEPAHAIAEQDEGDRRRQREGGPGRQRAGITGA